MHKKYQDLLREFSYLCGVSGRSKEVTDLFIRETMQRGLVSGKDLLGSASAVLLSEKERGIPGRVATTPPKRIMITAHADTVGYIVSEILDNSKVKLSEVGYPEEIIEEENGVIFNGRIKSPVIINKSDDIISAKIDNLEYKPDIGDVVYFQSDFSDRVRGKLCSSGMDNKSGIVCLFMIMDRLLKTKDLNCDIFFVITELEEVSGIGAKCASEKIKPNIAINVDVDPVEKKKDLGKGPIISVGPYYNRVLFNLVKSCAEDLGMKHRVTICGPEYETDVNYIVPENGGTPCCEVSIACFGIHTSREIVSKKDISSTARLVCETCIRLDSSIDYITMIPED